jgi:acetyltransferase-like isoleucine patch superfamily enzyme
MGLNVLKNWEKLQIAIKQYRMRRFVGFGVGATVYPASKVYAFKIQKDAIIIGRKTHIRGDISLFRAVSQVKIGDYCYLGENSKVWAWESISIGNRVLIAHDVNIFDCETHPTCPKQRAKHFLNIIDGQSDGDVVLNSKPVIIENDVWIGRGATIMKGITIGCGSIIGAGSVVTRSVEPMSLYAGNPARFIRSLKDEIND